MASVGSAVVVHPRTHHPAAWPGTRGSCMPSSWPSAVLAMACTIPLASSGSTVWPRLAQLVPEELGQRIFDKQGVGEATGGASEVPSGSDRAAIAGQSGE